MNSFTKSSEENERVCAIANYNMINSSNEEFFDFISHITSLYFSVPVAFVGLVETNRVWLQSKVGLTMKELKREAVFLHDIKNAEVMIVQDTFRDEYFSSFPLVLEERLVRFYVAAPIIDRNGVMLGILGLIDYEPRQFTEELSIALKFIAKLVVSQFESISLLKERNDLLNLVTSQRETILKLNRLSLLGKMTSTILHEINNPLASIILKTEQLMDQVKDRPLDKNIIHKELENILSNEHRIAKIILSAQYLYVRDDDSSLEKINLLSLVNEVLEFCHSRFKEENVEFRLDFKMLPETILEFRAIQLAQVLINLIDNSLTAIRNLKDKWISLRIGHVTSGVAISFTDSGTGIREELICQIMQPLFTTKKGKGGVGLNITRDIIGKHQGYFFYDKNSFNTTFVILLPLLQEVNLEKYLEW